VATPDLAAAPGLRVRRGDGGRAGVGVG
jgi:hypothetical protein